MATPKTILITGCSSGIGQALALEFKRRGHSVFATARQPAALQALTALGLNAVELDVTRPDSIERARSQMAAQSARLDSYRRRRLTQEDTQESSTTGRFPVVQFDSNQRPHVAFWNVPTAYTAC